MTCVVLGLGSNIGAREYFLSQARQMIEQRIGNITASSSVIKSIAQGYQSDNEYLNQVVTVDSEIEPFELLDVIHGIESELGRVRSGNQRYADRNIDIDILFYGMRIINSRRLIVPHPAIRERYFVLAPLAQIMPDFRHPITGFAIKEMLENITEQKK